MASVQMRRKGTNTNSPSAETHPEEQRFTPEVFTVQPRKGKGGNLCNLGIKDKRKQVLTKESYLWFLHIFSFFSQHTITNEPKAHYSPDK